MLKNFTLKPLLSNELLTSSIKQISPILKWDRDYSEDDAVEKLIYAFAHTESKQHVKGINAMTGELIVVKD